MPHSFRSYREQTVHYMFERPHDAPLTEPLASPAAWRGDELSPIDELAYHLTDDDIAEIEQALDNASNLGKPMRELTTDDVALPRLSASIACWQTALGRGLGFQIVRGVPVDRWSQARGELFFWVLGLHLGYPGGQNPAEELLGHVRNTGAYEIDNNVRLYQTSENIRYHCDAADVVGLLCLNKAQEGGLSRIVSSVTVFNELLTERPDLAPRLFGPVDLDVRNEGEGSGSAIQIQPSCYANGELRTFYHSDYFRSAVRHAEVGEFTPEQLDFFDTYEEIANRDGLYVDMDLQPGDIQLLSNHTNLHARTDYRDHQDPDQRRHLLRLWLSLPDREGPHS